ncbi:hypothetical protein M8494_25260 [Serratia ureilytica]
MGMWGAVALLAWRVWPGWLLFLSGMASGTALLVAALGHMLSAGFPRPVLAGQRFTVSPAPALFAAGPLLWQIARCPPRQLVKHADNYCNIGIWC